MIDFTADFNPEQGIKKLQQALLDIVDDELLKAVEDLQRNSPVGSTGLLKKSWEISGASIFQNEIQCSITNNAPNALNRLEGRKPGRPPPSTALEEWVKFKFRISGKQLKSVAFLVARKIGKEGTQRSKRNFKEFDPVTGQPVKNSAIDRALTRIEKKLNALK